MADQRLEQLVQKLERQMMNVEQILPTLATKADLLATKTDLEATLATKAELQAAVAPLATKAEMKAEAEQTRRHFDAVAESMHADVRLVAEGLAAFQERTDTRHADVMRVLVQHDRRLTRLEASPSKRR